MRLLIERSIASAIYRFMKQHSRFDKCTSFIEGLQKLANLPLTSVDTAVNKFQFRNHESMAKARSRAERMEYAEVLRRMLLVPRELMMDFYDGPWRWHPSLLVEAYISSENSILWHHFNHAKAAFVFKHKFLERNPPRLSL